jgi:hypothetical protein
MITASRHPYASQLDRIYFSKIPAIYDWLRKIGPIHEDWAAYDMFGYQHISFMKAEDKQRFDEWIKTL